MGTDRSGARHDPAYAASTQVFCYFQSMKSSEPMNATSKEPYPRLARSSSRATGAGSRKPTFAIPAHVDELARELFATIGEGTAIRIGEPHADIVLQAGDKEVVILCAEPRDVLRYEDRNLIACYSLGALEILWHLEDIVANLARAHPAFFRDRRVSSTRTGEAPAGAIHILGHVRGVASTGRGAPLTMERLPTAPAASGMGRPAIRAA